MRKNDKTEPEFSRLFELEDLGETPEKIVVTAKREECGLLATRFEQQSIARLTANLVLKWIEFGEVFSVSGSFEADVVQTCVISLEPISVTLNEDVNLVFASPRKGATETLLLEDAEPFEGEHIDLGELVAEELSLALEPYPRSKGVRPADIELGPGLSFLSEDDAQMATEKSNPFDILASLNSKA